MGRSTGDVDAGRGPGTGEEDGPRAAPDVATETKPPGPPPAGRQQAAAAIQPGQRTGCPVGAPTHTHIRARTYTHTHVLAHTKTIRNTYFKIDLFDRSLGYVTAFYQETSNIFLHISRKSNLHWTVDVLI